MVCRVAVVLDSLVDLDYYRSLGPPPSSSSSSYLWCVRSGDDSGGSGSGHVSTDFVFILIREYIDTVR